MLSSAPRRKFRGRATVRTLTRSIASPSLSFFTRRVRLRKDPRRSASYRYTHLSGIVLLLDLSTFKTQCPRAQLDREDGPKRSPSGRCLHLPCPSPSTLRTHARAHTLPSHPQPSNKSYHKLNPSPSPSCIPGRARPAPLLRRS